MTTLEEVDVVVVGAGPAGLAAGIAVSDRGLSVRVLERGAAAACRDRYQPADLVCGVGGAGLYSDGKFSFAPSATALWRLDPPAALREAYEWTAARLSGGGLVVPPFPGTEVVDFRRSGDLKAYPTQYMTLDARMDLILGLERLLEDRLVTGVDARLEVAQGRIVAEFGRERLVARTAVLASGRFGPLSPSGGLPSVFRRVEIGMRVEQSATSFALDAQPFGHLLDPKWIKPSPDGLLEWRTFCCCRRGEVVETQFGVLTTVSGRADGPSTGRSNFGLNVRFLDVDEAVHALARAVQAAHERPLRLTAEEFLADPGSGQVADRLGARIACALSDGLQTLALDLETDLTDAVLHLPAVEGVGYYPNVDATLRAAPGAWVAGDATGAFRGLVAALVSGRFAAMAASDSLLRP